MVVEPWGLFGREHFCGETKLFCVRADAAARISGVVEDRGSNPAVNVEGLSKSKSNKFSNSLLGWPDDGSSGCESDVVEPM